MPRSEKVRIEVYVPDLPAPAYGFLIETLEREFSFPFGAQSQHTERSGMREVWFESEGVRLFAVEDAAGQVIVMLTGGWRTTWRPCP